MKTRNALHALAILGLLTIQAVSAQDRGEALFKTNCASCHENKMPRAPFVHYLRDMMPQAIYGVLTEGAMRQYAQHLSNPDKRAIAEYLSGISMDEVKPARPQPHCANDLPKRNLPEVRSWGIDDENSRFTPYSVARLTRAEVPRLKLVWAFSFPNAMRARSQPTLAHGKLFVGGQNSAVHALDPKTGCQHWEFRSAGEVRTAITVGEARVKSAAPLFFGDTFGNVYSIDSGSGTLRWKVKVDDHPAATITGSPVVHRDRVYVPLSAMGNSDLSDDDASSCCTNRGAVIALDAASGRQIWKTYTIPDAPTQQLRNRAGTPQYGPAGASVMTSPTIDAKRGVLYIGTGQNHGVATDSNSDAIMALRLADGALVWKMQATQRDTWPASPFHPRNSPDVFLDFDFAASPILVRGKDRDILVAGQKSGEAFGLDPETGGIVWRNKLGRGGAAGGIHFSMARDGTTILVPMHDSQYGLEDIHPPLTGPAQPGMNAVDAFSGKTLWRKPVSAYCSKGDACQGISAAITAIPGVVFAARRDGGFEAFDTRTGEVLWSFDTARAFTALNGEQARGSSIAGGGPLIVDGMVYLNSGYGIYGSDAGNVLLAFSVDGE